MSFSGLLRKISQPNLASLATARSNPSTDDSNKLSLHREASETMPTFTRPWRRKRPSTSTGHPSLSRQRSTPASTPKDKKSISEGREKPLPIPLPTSPNGLTTFPKKTPPDMIPLVSPVPDKAVDAEDGVRADPKADNTNQGFNTTNDVVAIVQNDAKQLGRIISPTVSPVQQCDVGKAIKEGIDNFSESMPAFMNALDELKALHPFTEVLVLTFKTVCNLELKRRDDDKKIRSVFVGMRDMMSALFLLKDIENDKLIAPDGARTEDRPRALVERTVDDIRVCSNVCDAYMKKRLLAKVLLSSIWDAKLLEFVQLFATRRQEFEFELMMYTGQGVDNADAKLQAIGEATRALNEQMHAMKLLFQELVRPEQKRLSELVSAKGGVKALKEDDKVLLELEKAAGKASDVHRAEMGYACREQSQDLWLTTDDLRRDIFEDPSTAVEENSVVFTRKFEAQKNQIIGEFTPVKHESDRVVRGLEGGAHERILDKSIYEIWTDMGWRGNVKSRHLILALRDFYLEKLASGAETAHAMGTARVNRTPDLDAWAIKYIDTPWLKPILEAIDDVASGFITVGEMNRFTASRPIDWSLSHWVAFWAVGCRASIIEYAHKIEEIFAKMENIRTEVLPLNQQSVVKYLADLWKPVHTLISPILLLQPRHNDPEKFKSYLEAEEARLERNLSAVDYMIDGTDTLALITGVGRIEKTVFPLLYLLMKRHYKILRIMQTKVLDSRELLVAMRSVYCIWDAVRYRVDDLTNNFCQRNLNADKQFQSFAHGMFKYFNDPTALWSGDHILGLSPYTISYDDADEGQNVKVEDILRFGCSDEPSLDYWVYDGHSIHDIPSYGNVESSLRDILGHWHGYFYEIDGIKSTQVMDSMATLVLKPAEGQRDFKGDGWSIKGRFNITGSWSMDENGVIQIKFEILFQITTWRPLFFSGLFDSERDALTGVWGHSAERENPMGPLEFRRIEPHYLTNYPSIKQLSDNKPRALWKFAIAAVRDDIRQQRCSWSYFARRRDDRKVVVSLMVRYLFFGKPLDDEEIQQLRVAVQRLTPADACFYGSVVYRKRAPVLMHEGVHCDSCGGDIVGARLFCVDCVIKDGDNFETLDLCCSPESRCIDASLFPLDNLRRSHEPHHKLLKLRTVVLTHHYGRTYKLACAAFERVEGLCTKIAGASQKLYKEKQTRRQDDHNLLTEESTDTDMPSTRTDKLDNVPTKTEPEQTVTAIPSKNDIPTDLPDLADGLKSQIEPQDEVTHTAVQAPCQDEDLPRCGKCNVSLSFPFWHCIFCKDDLFICDACDAEGVPDLVRNSGKHTEEHHLIRCLAPAKADRASPTTEQRLVSIESRLDGMQKRFEDITTLIGNLEQLLQQPFRK